MPEKRPTGKPYSELYEPQVDASNDSEVMRRRIALEVFDRIYPLSQITGLAQYLERETGIPGPRRTPPGAQYDETWIEYFQDLDRTTFLDNITHVIEFLVVIGSSQNLRKERLFYSNLRSQLVATIARVFEETNTLLEVDGDGGIHPKVDTAFARQRISVVAGLDGESFTAAREYVDHCLSALREDPPDGAEAIRDLFLAAENIFKQMFPDVDRLDQRTVGRELKPVVRQMPDKKQLESMCAAFTQWVNVGQDFRHEIGRPEMNQPSEDLTTLMVTLGFSHIRWLASIQRRRDDGITVQELSHAT